MAIKTMTDTKEALRKNFTRLLPWKRMKGNARFMITRNDIKTALDESCIIPADKITADKM
jgi:hypothetical protein